MDVFPRDIFSKALLNLDSSGQSFGWGTRTSLEPSGLLLPLLN